MSSGKRLVLSAIEYGGRYAWVRDSYIIPHPYLLFVPRPGYQEFGFAQINSLGYRGHEIARARGNVSHSVSGRFDYLLVPVHPEPFPDVARSA